MALTIKQHDRRPYLVVGLEQPAGQAVDLTAASSVSLVMRKSATTGAPALRVPMEILAPATAGIVRYKWAGTNTDVVGDYDCEFEVMWGTEPQTFPTSGYYTVHIVDDLDD